MASDADYFSLDEPIERMKAKAAYFIGRIREVLRFHGAYQRAFLGEDGTVKPEMLPMLRDLAGFCLADMTTFDPDPTRAAANVGRREVWLHVQRGLRLDRAKLETLNRQLQELEEDE